MKRCVYVMLLMLVCMLLPAACMAEEPHKLSAPEDLGWGTYYTSDGVVAPYPGMIACRVTDLGYDQDIEVEVFRKGEYMAVHCGGWHYRANRTDRAVIVEHDFINNGVDLPSGDYYYTLRALGDGESTANSVFVTSGVWHYDRPDKQLPAPVGLRWDGSTAHWDAVPDADVGGYCF